MRGRIISYACGLLQDLGVYWVVLGLDDPSSWDRHLCHSVINVLVHSWGRVQRQLTSEFRYGVSVVLCLQ
jgi:hypothetical protein